ncbi:MAG TPA: secretin and TonB N-terminal domain-containing protein, partial [Pedomonas sp.]|uniref:STN domain-containing protein n=1 Tax=Pedomonas sp. TaxID=2976421 RepID=UPI002F3E60E1
MSQTNRFLLSLRRTTSTIATLAMLVAASAHAKTVTFDIPAQSLASAINEFSRQSGRAITAPAAVLRDKTAPAVKGAMTPEEALERLLEGTGLHIETTPGGAQVIQQRESSHSRAESPETTLSEIIVTAQKREERISDVPIAITALTSEGLDARKIEGGSELLRAIPNVNFSKSNFSMYNFSIRGVGTK